MQIFARRALCEDGWRRALRLEIAGGRIRALSANAAPQPGDVRVDTLLPALSNLHSHSFQRAMAGMTERRAQNRDSFWTWRKVMYQFLDRLTPDHIQAIAAQAFMEMQAAGYAAVGEFHYIHNAAGGMRYGSAAELSLRIFEAARQTGIGLTHLPVLYSQGGADGRPLEGGQLRFYNDPTSFAALFEDCQVAIQTLPEDARLGLAPHSLRAVSKDALSETIALHPKRQIHIHVAEQIREIEEITAHMGARPVEWLLDHVDVNAHWCLIHATHMTARETRGLAASGAVAGLCPVTEANLGDGIFAGGDYQAAGGVFGVGTDSNVNISLTEELRLLEYSQRLRDRARNVLADDNGSTGAALYLSAAQGGARALGRDSGRIALGQIADLVAIDGEHPALFALNDAQVLDGFVFAGNDGLVRDLWSAGRHQVRDGRHVAEEPITKQFRAAMRDLLSSL